MPADAECDREGVVEWSNVFAQDDGGEKRGAVIGFCSSCGFSGGGGSGGWMSMHVKVFCDWIPSDDCNLGSDNKHFGVGGVAAKTGVVI